MKKPTQNRVGFICIIGKISLLIHKPLDTLLRSFLERLTTQFGITDLAVCREFRIERKHIPIDKFLQLFLADTGLCSTVIVGYDKSDKSILATYDK